MKNNIGKTIPSYANELAYRKALLKIVDEMQEDTLREIKVYYDTEVIGDSADLLLIKVLRDLRKKWYRRFERLGKEFNKWFYESTDKRTQRQIKKKFKELGWTIEPHYTKEQRETIRKLSADSVKYIMNIPQKYLRGVQEIVSIGVEQGGNRQTIFRFSEKIYQHLLNNGEQAKHQAILFARDQSNRVTQGFARINAQAYGATKGRWIHVPGTHSSRITHIEMDGKTFDLATGMFDPDVKKNVQPGELQYCNCQFEVLLPGFE